MGLALVFGSVAMHAHLKQKHKHHPATPTTTGTLAAVDSSHYTALKGGDEEMGQSRNTTRTYIPKEFNVRPICMNQKSCV